MASYGDAKILLGELQGGNESLFDGGKSGDAQIADAQRQWLPHLTDPVSIQDQSFGKQPQGIDIQAEQGKKDYEQKKSTQTQPWLFAVDVPFTAALEAVSED